MEWEVYAKENNSSQLILNRFDHNSFFFLVSGSYGDIFPNLALLPFFIEKFNTNVFILIDSKWEVLTKRFLSNNLNFIYLNSEGAYRRNLMLQNKVFFRSPGVIYPLLPTLHPLLADLAMRGNVSDTESKKLLLDLDYATPFLLPQSNTLQLKENFESILLHLNCRPNKTIIFSFENNSNPPLKLDFIYKLFSYIKKNLDYDILINSSTTFNTNPILIDFYSNYPNFKVPSDYPIEFIEAAGYHVGTTHGLSMILSIFPHKIKHCLLINLTDKFINNNNRTLLAKDWLSFKNCLKYDYLDSNNNHEIFFTYELFDIFINDFNAIFNC